MTTAKAVEAAPKGLHAKLAELYEVVTHIDKAGTAPQAMGGFKFTQAADIAAAIRKALGARSLTMLPEEMRREEPSTITTRNGATLLLETIHIKWRITDGESGESATIESFGSGSDTGDKAIPKAITSSMKYALLAGFMVPQGDDPEREDQVQAGGGATSFQPGASRAPARNFAPSRPQARPQPVADEDPYADMPHAAAEIFGDAVVDAPSPQPVQGPRGGARSPGAVQGGGNPVCEACGAVYAGKPGDYWHRSDDGTIHRPAGQRRAS